MSLTILPVLSAGQDPYKSIPWKKVTSLIKNAQGEIIFEQKNVEAPQSWSQLAIDIAASKYFRRKLETSLRQLVDRVVLAIVGSAKKQGGYFKSPKDLKNFGQELRYILIY